MQLAQCMSLYAAIYFYYLLYYPQIWCIDERLIRLPDGAVLVEAELAS